MYNTAALNEVIACDSDFRIARDGTWFYQGSPMGRQAMVRLFSTILCKDGRGEYWLKTPAEQCRITVEDAPFVVIALRVRNLEGKGRTLCFKTNVNEWVVADEEHPLEIRCDAETGVQVPYIHVRDGLDAKLNRNVYYELMEYALAEGESRNGEWGVVSAGQFFALEALKEC